MNQHICKYTMHHNPSKAPGGEKYMHPRLTDNGKADLEDLIHQMAKRSSMTEAQLQAIVTDFLDTVGDELAQGKHVYVRGLGGFRFIPQCPPGIKDPDDVRAGNISVKGVEYKPDTELVKDLQTHVTFRRSRYKKNVNDDLQLIMEVVHKHFDVPEEDKKAISAIHLRQSLGLTSKRAGERLQELAERGILVNRSANRKQPLYMPGPKMESGI